MLSGFRLRNICSISTRPLQSETAPVEKVTAVYSDIHRRCIIDIGPGTWLVMISGPGGRVISAGAVDLTTDIMFQPSLANMANTRHQRVLPQLPLFTELPTRDLSGNSSNLRMRIKVCKANAQEDSLLLAEDVQWFTYSTLGGGAAWCHTVLGYRHWVCY